MQWNKFKRTHYKKEVEEGKKSLPSAPDLALGKAICLLSVGSGPLGKPPIQ